MADKVRAAFVGCGGIADAHAKGITTFQDVQLVGFYDVVPDAAKSLSQKYGGVTVYTDIESMFNEAKPDVVFYYLPPFAHGPEIEAAKRAVPFFVEKPVV
ncbi:MAG: Gfo/Idh/MocA family protein, partial [Thermoprotei archaeon]